MIHHIVMLDLPADHDAETLCAIMQSLDALRADLDGFLGFAHGTNRDFESLSPDCSYAFICQFADEQALRRYASDPRHKSLGERLLALCKGGINGLRVVDIEVAQ